MNRKYFRGGGFLHPETLQGAGESEEVIIDCPYCSHAWKADPRWTYGPCPNCGLMVYRYMDPRHD